MKATGIIRRIDDLGRIAIPKDIRRSLRIEKDDPLEIFIDNDCVVFKKYQSFELQGILNDLSRYLNDEIDKKQYPEIFYLAKLLETELKKTKE